MRIRRLLLELGAILAVACVIGFLGPFGTYLAGPFVERIEQWWLLLVGAYLLIRPCIAGFSVVAERIELPLRTTVMGGVVALSAPLAYIWRSVGQNAYRHLDGYAELVPFSLLCALTVLAVTWWAANIDRQLTTQARAHTAKVQPPVTSHEGPAKESDRRHSRQLPRLYSRLSAGFIGPIVGLQSEDHYVRVHGPRGSELLLMRLREAIAEIGGESGDQIHRSWWVARAGIARVERAGRSWSVHLINGEVAPVSRDAVYRLRQAGLLPSEDTGEALTASTPGR